MDRQIARLLKQEVQVESYSGMDERGNALPYASLKVLASYISGEAKMVRDVTGKEVVSNITLYFDGTLEVHSISLEDRVTLPDGRQPPIIAIRPYFNEKGQIDVVEVNL